MGQDGPEQDAMQWQTLTQREADNALTDALALSPKIPQTSREDTCGKESETPDPTLDEVAEQDSRATDCHRPARRQLKELERAAADVANDNLGQTGAAGGLGDATADGTPTAGGD